MAGVAHPELLHALPGRVRLHLPGWPGDDQRPVETAFTALPGVQSARANPLTHTVLVRFDPHVTDGPRLLAAARALRPADDPDRPTSPETRSPGTTAVAAMPRGRGAVAAQAGAGLADRPRLIQSGRGHAKRARITVRGLERDPAMAQRLVTRLERHPGVHAQASPLTGRVFLTYDEHLSDIEDLLSDVADVELPDEPGQDQPAYPMDPAPLVESAARTAASATGFGLLGVQALTGTQAILVDTASAATAAGTIGLIQGFPVTRDLTRRLVGRHLAGLLFEGAVIVSLTLSGNPLGLAVSGAEALRLLTEVLQRRRAWRHYEQSLSDPAAPRPGTDVKVSSGERAPLAAEVLDGTGTATGHDGLPAPIAPGGHVAAGAPLYGGPFVLRLQAGPPVTPQPRPAPPAPTLYDRYHRLLGPLSLAYGAVSALVTLSPLGALNGLLLINPCPAVIGADDADTGAAARAERCGAVVVTSRAGRVVQRPDALLLHMPRLLADGYEVAAAISLDDGLSSSTLYDQAAAVAAAAGAPWGEALHADHGGALAGAFDGQTATATLDGQRYDLGPFSGDALPDAARHDQSAAYLLALRRAGQDRPLGLIALRPRLRADVSALVAACRRHGVEVALVQSGAPETAQAIADRAGVPLAAEDDAVAAIQARQQQGAIVAFVSDNAAAAAAFAATDLAIGIAGTHHQFPAAADLLAPDLGVVAAVIEAGARRNRAARDAVWLSAASNVVGLVWGLGGAPGVEEATRIVYAASLAAIADGWLRLRGGRPSTGALLPPAAAEA